MSVIPAPWPVLHTARIYDDSVTDDHGNGRVVDQAPVVRYVIAYSQFEYKGPLSSLQIFSPEYIDQTVSRLHLTIPAADLGFYRSGDGVVVGGAVAADGSFSGGVAFMVDGTPASDLQGPWARLYRSFGGIVKLRRTG